MNIDDEIVLLADQDLIDQLARLEALGVSLREMPHASPGARALVLVDNQSRVLLACIVRLDMIDQIREMLDFYEQAIINPGATRH